MEPAGAARRESLSSHGLALPCADSARESPALALSPHPARTGVAEQRQEGDAGGDLADDGLDLLRHLGLGLCHRRRPAARSARAPPQFQKLGGGVARETACCSACHLPLRPTHPASTASLSVWMSKVQRSTTSLLATLVTTSTTFCSVAVPSHSATGAVGSPVSGSLCRAARPAAARAHPRTASARRGGRRRACRP